LGCDFLRGKLFVIEGIDGTGKGTQLKLLEEHLSKRGLKVWYRHYPDYDCDYGRMIREYLDKKRILSGVEELFMLYLIDMIKDRAIVSDEIGAGKVLIMDRYFLSTIAYQSASGFDYQKAKSIEDLFALQKPDVVFYINLSVQEAMSRKQRQRVNDENRNSDAHESDKGFQERICGFYEKMIREGFGTGKWVVLDGKETPEEIHRRIAEVVDAELGK
jgi:dTMP kinase